MPSPISKVINSVVAVKESMRRDRTDNNTELIDSDISFDSVNATRDEIVEQPRKRITWKRVLYHPLTWIAIGVHAALLIVPFNPAPPVVEQPKEETTEDEAIPIDLLNLSEIATSEPPPPESTDTPPPPPPDSATPPPAASPAPPQPSAQAAPPTPDPAAQPIAPDPNQSTAPDPDPTTPDPVPVPPNTPPAPAYDPSGDQQQFIANLGQLGLNSFDLSSIGYPRPGDFREEANAGFFVNGDAPAQGVKSAQQIDKQPSDVYNQITTGYSQTGITFQEMPSYGGEQLYHAITPQGDTLMYFSLARLKGSTLLVIWEDSPI